MERIDFIKEAVFLSGLSIEEVIQAFASDVSIEFLQELVQSQKEKLATYQQTTALSESERLVESPQVLDDKTEKQYELFTAESGKDGGRAGRVPDGAGDRYPDFQCHHLCDGMRKRRPQEEKTTA